MTPGLRGSRSEDPTLGLGIAEPERLPLIDSWTRAGDEYGSGYGEMIGSLRAFLNNLAAARPDAGTVAALADDLGAWSARLAAAAVPEREQMFAHRFDLPGRGQTMSPTFVVHAADRSSVRGTVCFGRYFLGGNGAVHGGAIPLLLDEVLGRLANSAGRGRSRTAYLHTDFRSITPVGVELQVHGWFVSEQGRKRVLRVELRDGEVLCAEGEGLFIVLNPGQP